MSRLKAFMRRSRSPMLAAWKSSGWSIMERAMRRAAQMFPDITWWESWRLLLFLCRLRAVRKLLAASLRGDERVGDGGHFRPVENKVFYAPSLH